MRTGANNWRGAPPPVGGRTSHVTSDPSTNRGCPRLCTLLTQGSGCAGVGQGEWEGTREREKRSPGGGSDPKELFPQPGAAGGGCDR